MTTTMIPSGVVAVSVAMAHLRAALRSLDGHHAPKFKAKIRLAISSGKGAERHALLAPYREDRQPVRRYKSRR